jgi:hypothetical protein
MQRLASHNKVMPAIASALIAAPAWRSRSLKEKLSTLFMNSTAPTNISEEARSDDCKILLWNLLLQELDITTGMRAARDATDQEARAAILQDFEAQYELNAGALERVDGDLSDYDNSDDFWSDGDMVDGMLSFDLRHDYLESFEGPDEHSQFTLTVSRNCPSPDGVEDLVNQSGFGSPLDLAVTGGNHTALCDDAAWDQSRQNRTGSCGTFEPDIDLKSLETSSETNWALDPGDDDMVRHDPLSH